MTECLGQECSSAATLTQPSGKTKATATVAPPAQVNAKVAAISEYTSALEVCVDKLKALVGDQLFITTGTEVTSAVTTAHTTRNDNLTEIEMIVASLANENLAQ